MKEPPFIGREGKRQITRRTFLKVFGLGIGSMSSVFSFPGRTSGTGKPNVLFIAVDDMNDWTSWLGGYQGTVHTPNMERLKDRSVSFNNAYCPSPMCNPSRAAIMTGLRPSTTGVYHNGQWWRPALPEVLTLPEYFKKHGYFVAGGGKIFHHTLGNNPPDLWDTYFPQVQDSPWHYNYPVPGQHVQRPGIYWPEGFPLNGIDNVREGKTPPGNYREFDWGAFDKRPQEMGDGKLIEWAEDFLQQQHDKPFFLATGIYRPHMPWYAPKQFFDLYPLDQISLPEIKDDDLADVPEPGREFARKSLKDYKLVVETGKHQEAVQAYLACISYADFLLGKLLDVLDKSEHAHNTIVIFWSDHGFHLGEKHHWHKGTLWERSTDVPFMISVPEQNTTPKSCDRPVGLIDLYPTLIDLCGLPSNPNLDGSSLAQLLKHPEKRRNRPALITYRYGNHAVCDERYRYIHYHSGEEELYDMKKDPHEWKNLATDPSYNDVKQELAAWLPEENAPNAPTKSHYDFDPATYTWSPK